MMAKVNKEVELFMMEYFRLDKDLLMQLEAAFPKEFAEDVQVVFHAMRAAPKELLPFFFDHTAECTLLSGEKITLPYRIYLSDDLSFSNKMTERQEMIYHCICSRNHNGYVRQKHIEALLDSDPPEWVLPYIIKICDEYIKEILEAVYLRLKDKNCEKYKALCQLNFDTFKRGHSRMISYWNEFYRYECYRYNDYIGKKLYRECFGYNKTGQKSIIY